ncbi:hypothetical protein N9B72_01360 [Bacteriovoracaceae bacterium]|nr:hypothetical protein [Bacteriovoracaceae bacterium]
MHSKWQVWDFFRTNPEGVGLSKGMYSFSFFNSFFQKILLDKLKVSKQLQGSYRLFTGKDCTREWVENNLMSLSLFGDTDSYIIIRSEEIPKDAIDLLLEQDLNISERFLVFFFEKECVSSKAIAKNKSITSHNIEEPKFWEFNKLLDFMASIYEIGLSFDVKNLILTTITHNAYEFSNALNILKLNYPDVVEVNLSMAKSVLSINRFDQFELATLVSNKRSSKFYEQVIEIGEDYNLLRSVFSFLQGHLIKIADPSYTEKKARLSKYDKEILASSRLWKQHELTAVVRKFSEYELLAKQKNAYLLQDLKRDCLRSY